MVVYDPDMITCEIYEGNYSRKVAKNQYRHLINSEKCAETKHRFGRITSRYLIYRGENTEIDGVQCLNV